MSEVLDPVRAGKWQEGVFMSDERAKLLESLGEPDFDRMAYLLRYSDDLRLSEQSDCAAKAASVEKEGSAT